MRSSFLTYICLFLFLLLSAGRVSGQMQVLKLTPLKLGIQRGLSFNFERVIRGPHSVGLGFMAVLPWNALNTAEFLGIQSSGDNWSVERLRFSGLTLTPEYRYYFQGRAPKGFYGGGFLRFFQYNSENKIDFTVDQNRDGTLNADFRFRGIGGGLELGYQKVFDNGFTIDYHIGVGFAGAGLRLRGDLTNILEEEIGPAIEEINEYLEQIPLLNVSLPFQDSFSINTPVASGPWPIARTSLSIGYAF